MATVQGMLVSSVASVAVSRSSYLGDRMEAYFGTDQYPGIGAKRWPSTTRRAWQATNPNPKMRPMLIPARVYNAGLTKLCDLNPSRYAFSAVRLERDEEGQPHAVTCDGDRLVAVTWKEDDPEEYPDCLDAKAVPGFEAMVPAKQWNEGAKLPPKRTLKPILCNLVVEETSTNGKVTIGATDLDTDRKLVGRQVEGRYPKWRDAIPTYQPHEVATVRLDAGLAAEMFSVLSKQLASDVHDRIDISVPLDGLGAVRIDATNGETTSRAVIMPLKPKGEVDRLSALAAYHEAVHGKVPEDVLTAWEQIASTAQLQKMAEQFGTK